MLPLGVGLIFYATSVFVLRRHASEVLQKARMACSILFAVLFYFGIFYLAPAVGLPLRDDMLLRFDEALFGQTPGSWLYQNSPRWLVEFFGAGYLTFEAYLAWGIVRAYLGPADRARVLHDVVLMIFTVGFAGYLLVPAEGPCRAYPGLFVTDDAGGVFTGFTTWVVDRGSSLYDVFPSLHIAVTLMLLHFDFRHARRLFYFVLPVATTTMIATIYLGYHYGVDLIAGVVLYLAVAWGFRFRLSMTSKQKEKLP